LPRFISSISSIPSDQISDAKDYDFPNNSGAMWVIVPDTVFCSSFVVEIPKSLIFAII
jgi:hypothetical protein